MKQMHRIGGALVLAGLALLLWSCEQKSSTGPASSTGPTVPLGNVTLTAGLSELFSAPGVPITTSVTATVIDTAGTAMPGILVHFTAPAIGSISAVDDTTDNNGRVTVTFNSQGQFGLAGISATATAAGITKTGFISIGIYPFTGLATNLNLSLSPKYLYLAEGVDTTLNVTVRVYDSLGVGIPSMQVSLSTTLGVVTIADITNQSGEVITTLNTNEESGMGVVTASVNIYIPDTTSGIGPGSGDPRNSSGTASGSANPKSAAALAGFAAENSPSPPQQVDEILTITDTDTFWVLPVDQQIDDLILSASPSVLTVAPDSTGSASVTAIVLDESNAGVAGVPVAFATDIGLLLSNTGLTNAAGMKTINFQTIPNVYGTARIWAVIGEFSDTAEVNIIPTASANGTLQIFTNTNLIYADGGMTYALMTALLKDADDQVISNAPIIFTSNYGTINSPVLTDSTGQAHATFVGILGFASFPDSATVKAKYTALNILDSLHVMIAPARTVDHIVLDANLNTMTANNFDSTQVTATVYLEDNALASPGTSVHFYFQGDAIGEFSQAYVDVGEGGAATTYYQVGQQTGEDSLLAEVEGIYSNPVVINLVAGPPSRVAIASDTSVLYVNSLNVATITATVQDTSFNLVENATQVTFSTTLGSLSPTQVGTINGVATCYLSPSTTAGAANVTARAGTGVDSTLINFVPSAGAYISLSSQWPEITVAGALGTTQTAIMANVRDASGNLVGNDVMVHFLILNNGFPFGGVNINDHGIEDSSQTTGGIATVVLNAGSNPGPVQIRAWTFVGGTEISAQQSLVAIVAGPPDYIDINSMSDPVTGQGDLWRVEVSALVLDAIGNEVPFETLVSFYILPENVAEIQAGGYTGNHSWSGDSLAGVAYTELIYNSDETFAVVTIVAYCMVGGDSVVGTQDYQLPLAEGELTLVIDPIAWNYDHPPWPYTTADPARMKCIAYLIDGHQSAIDDGTIIFFSTRGNFNFYNTWPTQQYWTSMKITGPNGFPGEPPDSTGYATLWLITTRDQAFPDPGAVETTGQVHCQVMGYFGVASDPITVTYQQDAN